MTSPILLQPVILSGGSGTRLWPLSREKYPKQLLSLVGDDTLLQATVRRVQGLQGVELAHPMVVCNEEYRFVIAEQLRLLHLSGTVVLEPCGRNTAPALTLAALSAIKNGSDPVLLVMPADHVITDVAAFQKVVSAGAVLADQGAVVTFGITPDAPETGYGYIQAGAPYGEADTARLIARFVEKTQPGDRANLPGRGQLLLEQWPVHDACLGLVVCHGHLPCRHSGHLPGRLGTRPNRWRVCAGRQDHLHPMSQRLD
ncbi:hypothetical protein MIZ03_4028 [Rhodoferax lithotrophicus]|uniref:Nucleotidyl transferase domain-containing protein n=1 Tax=Rhodoferax lithotrophicus TaxID=2798804 RepID=A0ABM7MRX4_9BURK|nr:hypothetical protein MIZ03_4028 [Rhodoferax sp. MIZ03]